MGRYRQAALVLIALAASACAAAADPPLRAARWLPAERRAHDLAFAPTECLRIPADPAQARRIAIGRAAFRTPLLLGGQAARAGLSCNACHREGRGNPDFLFRGLSGAPGTADVTSSLMSSHLGDGIDNPKPIPDLSGPAARFKVSRDPGGRALETFVRGLVSEEFDGPEPSALTLDALAAYVRALSPDACPAGAERAIDLEGYLADARAAARAAIDAYDEGDRATARLMLASARTALGAIDERYAGADLSGDREVLRAADRGLATLQADLAAGGDPRAAIHAWIEGMPAWTAALERDAPRSLFDADRLARRLNRTASP